MTERHRELATTERPATLGELSHTNPYTDESFGDAMVFDRGPVIAADGGAPETDAADSSAPETDADDAEDADADAEDAVVESADAPDDDETTGTDRLEDVDHTPPVGDGANRVHERGGEHQDSESV